VVNKHRYRRPRTARTDVNIKKLKQKLQRQKLSTTKVACEFGVSPMVILDKGQLGHDRYIKEVLPVALKYGNHVFGNDWTFQQDGATPHTHRLTQQWCHDDFPSFIDKDH
ncbi:unnamed protein product, partial [Adineta ricciae]